MDYIYGPYRRFRDDMYYGDYWYDNSYWNDSFGYDRWYVSLSRPWPSLPLVLMLTSHIRRLDNWDHSYYGGPRLGGSRR